jgi:hypothetical protein
MTRAVKRFEIRYERSVTYFLNTLYTTEFSERVKRPNNLGSIIEEFSVTQIYSAVEK